MCHTCNASSRQEKRCRGREPLITRGSTGFWGSILNININFKTSYFKAEDSAKTSTGLSVSEHSEVVGVAEYQLHLEYAITPFFPILEMDLHTIRFFPFTCIAIPVPQPHSQVCSCAKWSPRLCSSKGKPCGIGIYPQNAIFAKLSQKKVVQPSDFTWLSCLWMHSSTRSIPKRIFKNELLLTAYDRFNYRSSETQELEFVFAKQESGGSQRRKYIVSNWVYF